jgi:predicted nuclease of predicted toxin-antitoxin system
MSWNFLIDANLPVALAAAIEGLGHTATHVFQVSDERAPDRDIWCLARQNRQVVISRDRDFADLAMGSVDGPPVIWLRLGNVRKSVLIARIANDMPKLVAALNAGERLIELR